MNEDLQKTISWHFAPFIKNADEINDFYNTVNDEYKNDLFSFFTLHNKDKEAIKEYKKKAEALNILDKKIATKIKKNYLVFYNNLPPEQIKKQIDLLNSFSEEDKENLSIQYLKDIFEKDYSYALKYNDYNSICGTEGFKPFNDKETLKKELACLKRKKIEWVYTDEEIEKIINSEDDIFELSKILHECKKIKTGNISQILEKEGITLKRIKPGLDLIAEIQKNPEYEDIKDSIKNTSKVLYLKKEEAENFKKNLPILNTFKKYYPEEYKKDTTKSIQPYIISALTKKEIDKNKVESLLKQNILEENDSLWDLTYLIDHTNINELKEENINFLKDLRTDENIKELFNNNISIYDICEILNFNLPKDFKLENQTEMIRLVKYINSNIAKSSVLKNQYLELLTKDETFEDGVKLIDYIFENDINIINEITKHSFKDTLNIIKRINSSNLSSDYKCLSEGSIGDITRVLNLLDYAEQKNVFNDSNVSITRIINGYNTAQENNISISTDEEIKKEIDKMAIIAESIEFEIWKYIKTNTLENALSGVKEIIPKYKKENIEYLNKFITDERNKEKYYAQEYIFENILCNNLDINTLYSNYEDKMNLGYTEQEYITYLGDIKKLDSIIKELKAKGIQPRINVHPNQKDIIIESGDSLYIYDENLNLISEAIAKSDERKIILETRDYKKNTQTTIIGEDNPVYKMMTPNNIEIKFLNNEGDIIKTREYKKSDVDGVFNITEYSPTGEIKNICSASKKQGTETIKKNFESLDGTKSSITYKKDDEGNEKYTYKIIDKNGNVLLDLKRETKIIDEQTKITSVNKNKYKITYSEDEIKVLDFSTKIETILDLKKLNPEDNIEIKEILQSLPGDELIKTNEIIKKIKLTKKIESCINPYSKEMEVGPHKFIFEHELGHGKDTPIGNNIYKIRNNADVQKIFIEERNNYINELPTEITDLTDYFTKNNSYYNEDWHGLGETIAETNAIQSTGAFHPLLMDRTEFLQEYFPRTIAYITNNFL